MILEMARLLVTIIGACVGTSLGVFFTVKALDWQDRRKRRRHR